MSFKSKLNYRKAYKNMQDENYDNAVRYFKKSFDDYSDDLSFLYNFAYCYYQIKDYENCIEIINKLIYLDDSYEDAFNLKAGCLVYLGKFCEALNCLNDFLKEHEGSEYSLNHKNEIEALCNLSRKGKIRINIKG